MTTAPLLDLPESACASSMVMTLARVVGQSGSPYTLERQDFKWPGEAWSLEFTLPTFTDRETAEDWICFGLKLEGTFGRFLAGDPSSKKPRGVATGTPQVDGGGQSGNTLQTKGWSPNIIGILKKGDYIQLGTGTSSRLHKVVDDVNSDGAGKANLNIVPSLRTPPANSSAIVTNNARGVFSLVNNDFAWSVNPGQQRRLGFSAVEVVNA